MLLQGILLAPHTEHVGPHIPVPVIQFQLECYLQTLGQQVLLRLRHSKHPLVEGSGG